MNENRIWQRRSCTRRQGGGLDLPAGAIELVHHTGCSCHLCTCKESDDGLFAGAVNVLIVEGNSLCLSEVVLTKSHPKSLRPESKGRKWLECFRMLVMSA
jgi:hypothetical protein